MKSKRKRRQRTRFIDAHATKSLSGRSLFIEFSTWKEKGISLGDKEKKRRKSRSHNVMFTHIPTLAAVSNRFDTQLQARRNTLVTSRRILKKTANTAIDMRKKSEQVGLVTIPEKKFYFPIRRTSVNVYQ